MVRLALILGLLSGSASAENLLNALPPTPEPSFWEPALAVSGGAPERLVLRRLEALLKGLAAGSQAAKTHRRVTQAVRPTLVVQAAPTKERSKPWRLGSSLDLIERKFHLSLSKGSFRALLTRSGALLRPVPGLSMGWSFERQEFWQRWQAGPAISLDSGQGSVLRFKVTVTFNIGD